MQHLLKDVQQTDSEDTDNTSHGSKGQLEFSICFLRFHVTILAGTAQGEK